MMNEGKKVQVEPNRYSLALVNELLGVNDRAALDVDDETLDWLAWQRAVVGGVSGWPSSDGTLQKSPQQREAQACSSDGLPCSFPPLPSLTAHSPCKRCETVQSNRYSHKPR